MNRIRLSSILMAVGLLLGSEQATAQLLSPGKLAAPHADLEGMRNCTKCHVLGERGVANRLCLECHTPLRTRISQGRGFHPDKNDQPCSDCHKHHFAEDFHLVTFDTAAFDHSTVGFELMDAHQLLTCSDCHQPELIAADDVRDFKGEHGALGQTLLGLGTTCLSCHEPDNPHGAQFADRNCTSCHGQTVWTALEGFDHDLTRFRLTGLHRQLSCVECHQSTQLGPGVSGVQYINLRFARCTSCHQDIHQGVMGSDCTSCHSTGGWDRLNRTTLESRFDHETTGYSLVGAHSELQCASCHDSNQAQRDGINIQFDSGALAKAYPKPFADECTSCHADFHEGVFGESPGGSVCDGCHSQDKWLPTEYDIIRHNNEAAFALAGPHVAVPCKSCHESAGTGDRELQFRLESSDCGYCHLADDPHAGQFTGMYCTACHGADSFSIDAFDHSRTNYPLDGAHQTVPCESCHQLGTDENGLEYRVYKPLGMECHDCHGGFR